jgi:hypothetical protein
VDVLNAQLAEVDEAEKQTPNASQKENN